MTANALLDVLNGRKPSRRPVWFMRQAGRYLPEYRETRAKAGSFLELCYDPELACEVTLQPLRRFDLDAAILFADILVVPQAMGLGLRFAEGEGPVLETVGSSEAVGQLLAVAGTREVGQIVRTVSMVRSKLPTGVSLIGFCGGPWTVASYMVEGGSSDRVRAKLAALEQVAWFDELIGRLVDESVEYLTAQIAAGAQAVQIFDSWAGDLAGEARRRYVVEPLAEICRRLRGRFPEVPAIVFARGVGTDHRTVAVESGCAAVGVESEARLDGVLSLVPDHVAVQGNLDPACLLGSAAVVERETKFVLKQVPLARHIFNLGHGIRPETDLHNVGRVIDCIRAFDRGAG